ncbi:MAG: heat-inducible transcriptional repressor HrcA [Leucobacter sp.]
MVEDRAADPLSERGLSVLHAIVSDYIESNEPVGSKVIVDRHSFGVSAATIRNDMALLEDEDLIEAPHTSSGRIPTDKGYRLYVDTLPKFRPLSQAQRTAIEQFLGESNDLDDVMARTVRLLARLTNQVAVVQYPSLRRIAVRHVDMVLLGEGRLLCVLILGNGVVEQQTVVLRGTEPGYERVRDLQAQVGNLIVGNEVETAAADLIQFADGHSEAPTDGNYERAEDAQFVRSVLDVVIDMLRANRSDRISISGAANLTRPGEFEGSLPVVLGAIEEQVTLLRLFGELVNDSREISTSIGRENEQYGLAAASVIASSYENEGDSVSRLGVLGPLRMDYAGNMATVRAVARYLSRLLNE